MPPRYLLHGHHAGRGRGGGLVLLAILHLGEGVYGVPIVDQIARRTGREVAPAAVYVTLSRQEHKVCWRRGWVNPPVSAAAKLDGT